MALLEREGEVAAIDRTVEAGRSGVGCAAVGERPHTAHGIFVAMPKPSTV